MALSFDKLKDRLAGGLFLHSFTLALFSAKTSTQHVVSSEADVREFGQ